MSQPQSESTVKAALDSKKRVNKALAKRTADLEKILVDCVGDDTEMRKKLMNLQVTKEYLKNGAHGATDLAKMLKGAAAVEEKWAECKGRCTGIDNLYIYILKLGYMRLDEVIELIGLDCEHAIQERAEREEREAREKVEREERREQLQVALLAKGLMIRSDSVMCNRYINGYKQHSLEQVVDIMVNMDWLHKHTRYSEMIREAMRDAYYDARDEAEDEWDVDAIVESRRTEISEDCQARAVKSFLARNPGRRGDVPSGLRKYVR